VSYDYDEETRTETIVSARGTTVYQYDESGRLLSRKDPEGPYIDGDGASIEYVYDENRVTVKTANREIVYEYNEDGTLKSVTTPEGTTEYRYEDGVLVKTIFPNETAEVIVYDPLGRIDVIKTVKIDPVTEEELAVLASYDYEVDDAGNREEVIDHNGRKVEYEYDELNRVVEEKISNPLDASEDDRTITYVYDAVGNLDYKGDTFAGDTDFVYNNLNQLVRSTLGGVETVYTYDDNGSLKTRTTGEKSVTYHWENDGENRLKGVDIVEGGQTTEIDYEYNEQGIRTGKSVNGVETNYLIDELQPYAQVLEEYDALGNLQNAYVYGNDLVSQSDNNETFFYHVDGLGSTRVLTDESGNIEESYNYDAYGNLMAGDASENAYLFAGEQRDIETGLDYLRARYYDTTLGRFISRDAYQGSLNDPMSQHKYQYVHANPVVNTDPSGYKTLTELAAVAAITATLGGLGLTTVGAIGTGLNGGSTSDVLSTYDQYFAGMMDAMTFGISTQIRRLAHGNNATQNHKGLYFNLGRFGGAIASTWVGSYAASFAGLKKAPWWAKAALGYDLFGAGAGIVQSTINVAKGQATWWDILPFLVLLPLLGVNLQLTSKGLRKRCSICWCNSFR
jgi:RHS repeat-associated protein